MVAVKKLVRQNQVLQVIQYSTDDGMSITKACQVVGLSRSVFYRFCSRHPDLIAAFQQMQVEAGMRELALILDNQFDILENVVQDALADTTKPRQRLAIYKYLIKRVDELMEAVHADRRDDGEIDEMLRGPKLVKVESRFSASEKEVSLMGNAQYSAYTAGS